MVADRVGRRELGAVGGDDDVLHSVQLVRQRVVAQEILRDVFRELVVGAATAEV